MRRNLLSIVMSVMLVCSNCFLANTQAQEKQLPYVPESVAKEQTSEQAQPPAVQNNIEKKSSSVTPATVLRVKKMDNNLFSMELRDVEIGDLLRVLAHDYNLNIIMDKKVKGRVTASFSNISLDEALARIVDNNNLAYKKIGNVIKVTPNLITKTFVLKYLQAKNIIQPESSGSTSEAPVGSASMSASGNSGSQSQYSENSSSTSGTGGGNSSQMQSTTSTTTMPPPQAGPGGATEQAKNNNIYDLLSPDGKIFFDNEANSIMVIDYPQNVKRIGKYLSKVDTLPRQVLIEARIVEVKLQKEHSLGVNWKAFTESGNLPIGSWRIGSAASTLGDPPGPLVQSIGYKSTVYPPGSSTGTAEEPFSISIFDKNINIVLKMLTATLDTDVLSAPRVTTVNNREATIEMIQRYPWAEPQVNVQGQSGSMSTGWTVNYENLGIVLKVVPTINKDGTITMVLDPEITDKTGDYPLKINQGTTTIEYSVPIIDKRSASTKVVVGNGQTLILGGLIKDKITKGESKIPLMGDLPYVGYLFKSKKETRDKTELLIFVSPTIITRQKSMPTEDLPVTNWRVSDKTQSQQDTLTSIESKAKPGNFAVTPLLSNEKITKKPAEKKNKKSSLKNKVKTVKLPVSVVPQLNNNKELAKTSLETELQVADKNKKVQEALSLLEDKKTNK